MENKITQFVFNKVGIPNSQKYLDLASLKHKLIASNVANVATPGYKSESFDFHNEFQKVSGSGSSLRGVTTNPNHIPTGQHESKAPKVYSQQVQSGEMNSVDIDKEIASLAQNELLFEVGATLLQRKFEGLRKAIQSK